MNTVKLVGLLLLASPVFAHHGSHGAAIPWPVMSAKDARQEIFDTIYQKHAEAIDWWVQYINNRILVESRNVNACVSIDIRKASSDVQSYLVESYEREGYHIERVPGWDEVNNKPDGTAYLSLSW